MDYNLVGGVIGLITALISFIYIIVDKGLIPRKKTIKNSQKFVGEWTGSLKQNDVNHLKGLPEKISIRLKRKRNRLHGHFKFRVNTIDSIYLKEYWVSGVVKHNRFFNLEYQHKDAEVLSFGSIILEINPANNELN